MWQGVWQRKASPQKPASVYLQVYWKVRIGKCVDTESWCCQQLRVEETESECRFGWSDENILKGDSDAVYITCECAESH